MVMEERLAELVDDMFNYAHDKPRPESSVLEWTMWADNMRATMIKAFEFGRSVGYNEGYDEAVLGPKS